ncbi:MAG: hypothetical protein ACD_58C00172G0005 [uncultured bacterium]|nr:MAG: hypothetical protein ACD_58C00172G0005 [uncultured bacterium]
MINNQEIQKKLTQNFIIWIVVTNIVLLLIIVLFNYRLTELSFAIQDKKSQTQAIRNRENNINQLQDKYYQIVNDISVVTKSLPDEENIANFVKYLEDLSSSKGTNIEILFDEKVNSEVLKNSYLIFSLNVSGPGSNVSDFWQSLEKGTYFVNVSNFNFDSTNGLSSDTKLSFKAKVYTNDPYRPNK